jgi:hypothetical protein
MVTGREAAARQWSGTQAVQLQACRGEAYEGDEGRTVGWARGGLTWFGWSMSSTGWAATEQGVVAGAVKAWQGCTKLVAMIGSVVVAPQGLVGYQPSKDVVARRWMYPGCLRPGASGPSREWLHCITWRQESKSVGEAVKRRAGLGSRGDPV